MKTKAFLITDSGYEYSMPIAVVLAPEDTDMYALQREFEEFIGFKPEDIYSKKHIRSTYKTNGKITLDKLVALGLYTPFVDEEDPTYKTPFSMQVFLAGFTNWLVKYKGLTEVEFDEIGYSNCG